jgi:hypothetical protein
MYKGVAPCRYRVSTVALPMAGAGEPAYGTWQMANRACWRVAHEAALEGIVARQLNGDGIAAGSGQRAG